MANFTINMIIYSDDNVMNDTVYNSLKSKLIFFEAENKSNKDND